MVRAVVPPSSDQEPTPCWDVARLYPGQGAWTESDYLSLSERTSRTIELVNGSLEVPELPTLTHQMLVLAVRDIFQQFAQRESAGRVVVAPYPMRIGDRQYREPDVLLLPSRGDPRVEDDRCHYAHVVVEVLSKDRNRDLIEKRIDYAKVGIPEYWVIDPVERRVEVLRLEGDGYASHGVWSDGEVAFSATYPELRVDVSKLFAAAE